MKRIGELMSAALCALVLTASLTNAVVAQTGDLLGRVVSAGTGEPVVAAIVTLVGSRYEAVTDGGGVFRLRNLPAGRYRLQVKQLGYSEQTIQVEVRPDASTPVEITVSAAAITLAPLTVEAMSADERRDRGAGTRRSLVTREQIQRAESTHLKLGDLLQLAAPSVRVRRQERTMGSPVCIELRTIRAMQANCLSPVVVLDGVPISNPTSLYDNIDTSTIETLEVLHATESAIRYGSGALYGAILITTRRPGSSDDEAARKRAFTSPAFNWSLDSAGHNTTRVFLSSALANSIGLAIGVSAAAQCIGLRKPGNDGIISDCALAPTLGSAAAAIMLPALASGFAAGLTGKTNASRGDLAPAIVGATMTILPGYALVFSGHRNNSESLKWIGYSAIVLGTPLVTTAADYLFRKLKH